jgi:hypothetical protein
VPERFSAYIGGFMGASYGIELRAGTLTYTSSDRGRRNTRHARITPTAEEWREFQQALDDVKVWQWRADYPSQGTVDGTQWSLDIAYADHTVKCRGNNSYPDANGKPNGRPDPTPTFDRYLAAIKKLIGGRSFR